MRPLREHRRSQFLSIEVLAAKSGVSTKTIVETELGRTLPKFRTILRLSEALGIDPATVTEFAAAAKGEGDAEKKAA